MTTPISVIHSVINMGSRCSVVILLSTGISNRGECSLTTKDLERLHKLPRQIDQKRYQLQHLRDMVKLKGSQITGMPHSGGIYDKIGEIVPAIVDTEAEIRALEHEYYTLQSDVQSWADNLDDIKAGYLITLRYCEGYSWGKIADEISGAEGGIVSEDAARQYVTRYLKAHCE